MYCNSEAGSVQNISIFSPLIVNFEHSDMQQKFSKFYIYDVEMPQDYI